MALRHPCGARAPAYVTNRLDLLFDRHEPIFNTQPSTERYFCKDA